MGSREKSLGQLKQKIGDPNTAPIDSDDELDAREHDVDEDERSIGQIQNDKLTRTKRGKTNKGVVVEKWKNLKSTVKECKLDKLLMRHAKQKINVVLLDDKYYGVIRDHIHVHEVKSIFSAGKPSTGRHFY